MSDEVLNDDTHFDRWNTVKKRTHATAARVGFKERDIFWMRLGRNIGAEEYGKGREYQRPVIIVKRLTRDLFFGVPLSTVLKEGPYFHTFTYRSKKGDRTNCAMLLQLRAFDRKRLMGRLGMMPKDDFELMMKKIRELFIPSLSGTGLPEG